MKDVPVSCQFDDIYFSKEDGLAETAHVFLKGNNLPENWTGKSHFTICETGFGTGLNFFSAWKLFEETSKNGQTLDYISFEKYPLKPEEIESALSHWANYFEGRIEIFLNQYPLRINGFHRIKINQKITLTLIFDDVNKAMPKLKTSVDCWFLDGFTPSKNPEMWSEKVFQEMSRLSSFRATLASFTAAGDVRRSLKEVGFDISKQKGFSYKREMITGIYKYGVKKTTFKNAIKTVAIIGGGLAGTSCAYVLKQYGFEPVIYEITDRLASQASGNSVGLYNPRFSKTRDNLSDFFAPAYAQFIRVAKQAGHKIDYNPCGALHLMNEMNKTERYQAMSKNWGWHEDHIHVVDAKEASEISGIELQQGALYLPDSGSVNPQKLCEYYAQGIEVNYNQNITDLKSVMEDAVILACAGELKNFKELGWLELDIVRGQISDIEQTEISKNLKCNIHYGGYMSAAYNGQHSIGSTFEKWVDHVEVTQKNHDENLEILKSNISIFENENFKIANGRAGMRAATNDRFPVIGQVPNYKNVYVSGAFGSHGIVSSIAGAHLIADFILGNTYSLAFKTIDELSPRRFMDRAAKKGNVLV